MQSNSTNFTGHSTVTSLNFLNFIKDYPACRPAAYKKFQQSHLGRPAITFLIDRIAYMVPCVAITYRVHDFENFDENFVQGTISPLLKSHIPLDGSVSLFKYLPTELKRI